ncbi:hypothetical protein DFJ58DRAFT_832877, partial [Suillus subalutaceus]|uniref:uncharacterized protein n=1 Tax=Suillus subalutaceus TaxID=48586 RepID=UPI001B868E38
MLKVVWCWLVHTLLFADLPLLPGDVTIVRTLGFLCIDRAIVTALGEILIGVFMVASFHR